MPSTPRGPSPPDADLLGAHADAVDDVGRAHEARHERRRGPLVDLVGGPACSTRPSLNTTTRSASVSASSWSWVTSTNVMPESRWIRGELDLHLLAQLEVERAEGLVEQEHGGLVDQRAGQRHPLPLAAGQGGGRAVGHRLQAHGGQRRPGPLAPLGLAHPGDAQRVLDVAQHRQVREQRVVLEDGVHVALERRRGGDVLAAQRTVPAVGRSKPAIIRSTVVLPEPDGPSSVTNSPSATSRSRPVDGDDPACELLAHAAQRDRRGAGGRGVGGTSRCRPSLGPRAENIWLHRFCVNELWQGVTRA